MLRPVHFEIPAADAKRAIKFFTDVFGWTFQTWGGDDMGYYLTETGPEGTPGINGAIMQRRDPAQPVVNSIEVPSVDDFIKKVEAAGGEIVVPKQPIPSVGYMAYFKDTEGNIHGLWQQDPNAK